MPQTLFYYNYAGEPLWGEGITLTVPQGGFANPWLGYPGGSPYPVSQNPNSTYPQAGYYETVPLHVQNTYVQQWNLTLQRQVGSSWLFKASYLGNETAHLWTDQELNPAVLVPNTAGTPLGTCPKGVTVGCNAIANTQQRRLLTQLNPSQGPYYGQLEYLDDGGTASYNALIVSAEHRLSSHFSMLANYTWSHCIGDPVTTELSGPIYTNPNDRRFDRGNCAYIDIHHNFNLSAVLQSPHYSNRAVQWIAGDWQLAPIVGLHSGSYFAVTTGVDDALNSIGAQRPNQIASNVYCANRNINCWMSSSAFAAPAFGTLGSLGNNSLEGPGYFDVDVSLSRQFRVKEKQYFEIRAESFNIQNRANYLNPGAVGIAGGASNSALNSSTFGKIQSDVAPRIMQFAVKYAF